MVEAASRISTPHSYMEFEAEQMAEHEVEDAIWEDYAQADDFAHAAYTGGQ